MSSTKSGPRKRRKQRANSAMIFFGVGMSISIEMLVSTLLGWWLGTQVDAWLDTAPVFTVLGILIFLSASIFHAIIVLNHLNRRIDSDENRPS